MAKERETQWKYNKLPKKIIYISLIVLFVLVLTGYIPQIHKKIVELLEKENSSREKSVNQNSWYKPKPGISWQWQLTKDIDTSYDVDLYDIDLIETPQAVIDELHSRNIKVICYISTGSWEDWRPDKDDFPKSVLGKTLEGWENEKWLDISKMELLAPIMEKRLDLAKQKGCDGVEPDNVDGYLNDNGFSLTYSDQLNYNKWLAEQAHKRGLSIGLKNDLDQINDLVDYYDFAVVEECFQYDECDPLIAFIQQDKAVFGVEYELEPNEFCEEANRLNFSWLKMNYDLDGSRISCK